MFLFQHASTMKEERLSVESEVARELDVDEVVDIFAKMPSLCLREIYQEGSL
jgi:hypothetical protein